VRGDQAPPANPADFMPALGEGREKHTEPGNKPTLLKSPAEQAALMRKVLFKKDA
jgi:hypothetical protein